MKRDIEQLDFSKAYPPMPEGCRRALRNAACSVREDAPARCAPLRVVVIACLLVFLATALALAATRLGWADLLLDSFGVTLPRAAREALQSSQPAQYRAGPVTFTFDQLLCDPAIALSAATARLTDGTEALYACDTGIYDPVDLYTDAVRAKYNLPAGMTWIEAARRLGLPLYGVRALLEVKAPYAHGEAMEYALWNADGSIVYFNMPALLPGAVQEALPAVLYMAVTRYDPATGEEMDVWRTRESITLPVSPLLEEKTYLPAGADTALDGLHLQSVSARRYATGVYLTCAFALPEGADSEALRDALHTIAVLDAQGGALPEGVSLSGATPAFAAGGATLTALYALDALPESLLVTNGKTQISVQ